MSNSFSYTLKISNDVQSCLPMWKNIKFVRMIFLIRISETRGAVVRNSYINLNMADQSFTSLDSGLSVSVFCIFFLFRALIKQWDTKFLTRIDKEELKIITKLLPDIFKKEDIIFIKAIYMTFNIYTLVIKLNCPIKRSIIQ